jgi:hypothetical protein
MKVLDYATKVPKQKLEPGKRYFGIELELASKDVYENAKSNHDYNDDIEDEIQESADKISFPFEGWSIFKFDGSVLGGFEIVSYPLEFSETKKRYNEGLFKLLDDNLFISYTHQCAGMHVHVSKSGLTPLQISKAVKLIYNPDNRAFIKKIAQREEKQYAEFSTPKSFGFVKRAHNKYDAVNLINKETVEFRLFRGTLSHSAFHKNIEFCDALLNFCHSCVTGVKESSNWFSFMDYVRRNKKIYPNLWSYCVLKQMESTDSWAANRLVKNAEKEQKKLEREAEKKRRQEEKAALQAERSTEESPIAF